MQMQELTVMPRDGKGKQAAKRLRREGRVPAILYGGAQPKDISVDPKAVLKMIHGHEGSTQLLSLKFDGGAAATMAIIRDMQFDPVSENLLHVDLQEVSADRAINVHVAVHPVGEAIGVKDTKGILNLVLHELEISCLPTNIPARIDADVTNLAIGDVLTVRDLTPPEGVRILNDPGQAVATVSPPMAEEEAAAPAVAAAATATAEPEVLTERKPKDDAAADDKKPAAKK
jgi:large subunit ribosomal protein L25